LDIPDNADIHHGFAMLGDQPAEIREFARRGQDSIHAQKQKQGSETACKDHV
jgi:hypothetical protein